MKKFFLLLLMVDFGHAAGGPGNALYFIDSFDSVSVPHTNALNAYPFTVTTWFQLDSGPAGPEPIDLLRKFDGAFNGWRIQFFNERLYASYFASGTNYVWDGAFGLDFGFAGDPSWHHLAFTVDASGGKVYLDGVLRASRAWTGTPAAPTTTQNFLLCGSVPPGPLNLWLDEVMIWNVALSQAQIQANKNRSLTGNESGLVAYYRCDESAGSTTLGDSAPAGGFNHGSLAAFAVLFEPSDVFPFTPFAQTLAATAVGSTNATLNGVANPAYTNTSAWFEWGTTTNYGNATAPQPVGSGVGNVNFSRVLTGLGGGITYHFRAVASNALGAARGTNQSFSTPMFVNINAALPGVFSSAAAWGDYDHDGRLDIVLNGLTSTLTDDAHLLIWRNTPGGFVPGPPFLLDGTNFMPGNAFRSLAWGDYDNDGRLDVVFSQNFAAAGLFRNGGISFTNPLGGMTGIQGWGVATWGDYNNDGPLDLLFSGSILPALQAQVFRNTNGNFVSLASFGNVYDTAAWGDYDADGYLDFILGANVWRGLGSVFNNSGVLASLRFGSANWGDYDNDGRLDVVITGTDSGPAGGRISQVWRNTGAGFTNINAGLPGAMNSSATWGDYDSDGRLDILLTGSTSGTSNGLIAQVWRNTGVSFTLVNSGLPGVWHGAGLWADYDNDGRLDILLTGLDVSDRPITQIWRNLLPASNSPPTAPSGLRVVISNSIAILSWTEASDTATPSAGLNYNLRIGTTPGGSDVMSPMSAPGGKRFLAERGLRQARTFALFNYKLGTPYYWSVQAVDTSFTGSPFAAEHSFRVLDAPPVTVPAGTTNFVSGDLNNDGVVTQADVEIVLARYLPTSPWLQMTNVAGLGGTNVTFALTNDLAGALSVEYTTDLLSWFFLGPATPRYEFTDTNAPAVPRRYYRLRWP